MTLNRQYYNPRSLLRRCSYSSPLGILWCWRLMIPHKISEVERVWQLDFGIQEYATKTEIFCDIICGWGWPERDYYEQHCKTPQIIPDHNVTPSFQNKTLISFQKFSKLFRDSIWSRIREGTFFLGGGGGEGWGLRRGGASVKVSTTKGG